jgi:glycosyltransferase involved in cell wall biosynthesis
MAPGKMMAKNRILFVIGSLITGGAEAQLAMLAIGLKARGWAVDIFTLEKTGELLGDVQAAGIEVIDGGYRSASGKAQKLIALALAQLRLFWWGARYRPRIVHAFLPITNFFGAVAGRISFVPMVIASKRAMGTHQERIPIFRKIDRAANALAHVITANSKAVAADTSRRDGCDLSRIVIIPNGLDFRPFEISHDRNQIRASLGLSRTDIAIAMVANLIPYKGHADLIEAFSLVTSNQQLKMFFIGRDDGIAASLKALAHTLGVADRLNMLGLRNDVPSLLSAMDVGVMASDQEGFSNAVLEKLAAGIPVVATDIGGNSETLRDMPGCFLVRTHDPADLARGLEAAIAGLISDHGREVRRRLVRERYSVDAMVNAYERLYLGDFSNRS